MSFHEQIIPCLKDAGQTCIQLTRFSLIVIPLLYPTGLPSRYLQLSVLKVLSRYFTGRVTAAGYTPFLVPVRVREFWVIRLC